jgi:hypothetical protein
LACGGKWARPFALSERMGREILQNVSARMRLLARRNDRIGYKRLIFQEKSAIKAFWVASLTGATECR